ncbi:MAG: FtsX-like permease family protein [Anaerolineales bacterium]
MLFLKSTSQHMVRHLGMNLAVLFCLSIGAGLIGSLPSFAASAAERSLKASLENAHPSVRNIKVTAPASNLNSALSGYINETIGDLLDGRVQVSNIQRDAHPSGLIETWNENNDVNIDKIWVWSFDKLTQLSTLLTGKWPTVTYPKTQAEAFQPPTIEAAISGDIASRLHIHTGDILKDSNEISYLVTGIVQFNDPAEDVWWQDNSPISITTDPGLNEDTIIVPIFIHQQSLRNNFRGFATEWRYILKPEKINRVNAEIIETNLLNLKNRLSANNVNLSSGLPDLVQEFRQSLSTSRIIFYLLSIQAFLFVVFTLLLMANLLVSSSQSELATMISRGASRFQITLSYAIQALFLALIAGLVLGPLIAWIGLNIWGMISGEKQGINLTVETWYMSLLASGIGWLALVVAVLLGNKSNVVDQQQSLSRPDKTSTWQRKYFDIFLFLLGLLFFWQLSNSGSFVMKRIRGSVIADPLLLIGPSILLIAIAMLFIRLFPVILTWLTALIKSGRGTVLPVGLARLARNPRQISWIVLLISMASGLILFAYVYSNSLSSAQEQIAVYQAGSNLRLNGNKVPQAYIDEIAELLPTSHVARGRLQEKTGKGITLLAVQPDTFAEVTKYPEGMTNLTMDIIMDALRQPLEDPSSEVNPQSVVSIEDNSNISPTIPAIFSYASLPAGGKIGDLVELSMASQPIIFEIRGIIADFPTVSNNFVIVNIATFYDSVEDSISRQLRNNEYWISVDEQTHNQLVSFPTIKNAILGDSISILNVIRNHIMTLGTVRAFSLNALILAIISMLGLLIANYFSYYQREYEFGILRAFGLSGGQSNSLLVGEGVLVLSLGLISGVILGYLLTRFMRPYISLAVSRTLPGLTVHQIDINWLNIAAIVCMLLCMYLFVLALIMFALRRSNINQVLRTGDE